MYKETTHDYNIKYRDTYVVWVNPEDGTRLPGRVVEFSSSNSSSPILAKLRVYPKKIQEQPFFHICDVNEIDFTFLNRGCINLKSSVFVLNEASPQGGESRHRAGLNLQNTRVIDPFKVERRMLHSIPLEFENGTILNAIVENKYSPAVECLNNVSSLKRLGQAFSNEYFFGLKWAPNSVMLFKRDYMIGRVNPSNGTILLKPGAHPLYEEISEYGLNVERVSK